MLFSYSSVIPFCYRSQGNVEWLSCWLNYATICKGHCFRESAGHDSCCGCPITRTEFNWMYFYFCITHEGRSVLLGGDVIVSADSKDIRSKHDLLLYLESKKVGQPVELSVIRDGSPQQIMVILGQRPALGEFS